MESLGQGVDLFIIGTTDRVGEHLKKPEARKLLISQEAGYSAAKVGAHRLLLAHFWPGSDIQAASKSAEVEFGKIVVAAEPGMVLDLAPQHNPDPPLI